MKTNRRRKTAKLALALLVCLFAFLLPQSARAQGGILSGGIIVISSSGKPVGGATVTVCNVADNGIPCTQTISIYQDPALTIPAANPGQTDGNGNFIVFAAPGSYHYTVTGNGVKTTGQPFSTTALCTGSCPVAPQVFYAPVKCDNSTNITSALNSFISAVSSSGTIPIKLILPGGTCLVSSNVQLPDNFWLAGSGVNNTTIKQIAGTNDATHAIFVLNGVNGNATISDLTIDGNKAAQSSGWCLVANSQTGDMSGAIIQHNILKNAFVAGICLNPTLNHYIRDFLISENNFVNNSTSTSQAEDNTGNFGDIVIRGPVNGRIHHNESSNGQSSFAIFGTNGNPNFTVGPVVVDHNIVTNGLGYGVALGGGGGSGNGAIIDGNYFFMPNSRENTVDLALWNGNVVSHNTLYSGLCTFCSGVADGPPSSASTITGNFIVANFAQVTPGLCIGNGGNVSITDNFCDGAGIGLQLAANTIVDSAVVEGNTVINARGLPGLQTLLSGGSSLGNVTIKGNHFYDDQTPHTQTYGIALASQGATTGYSNFTIEGNDVRNNLLGGILNNTSGATGMVFRGNPGFDPLTDATGGDAILSGNASQTTLYTTPPSSFLAYQVSVSGGIIRQATSSSTAPTVNITYTDADSNAVRSIPVPALGASLNSTGATSYNSSFLIYANTATAIGFNTTGYASSGATSMQYSLHIRIEAVN